MMAENTYIYVCMYMNAYTYMSMCSICHESNWMIGAI